MEQFELITYILRIIVYGVLALILLFMKMPNNPELKNYVISRRTIAFAYLCLVAANSMHLFSGERIKTELSLLLFSGRFILVSALQALLFTYSLITLLDAYYVTKRRVCRQLALIGVFYLPIAIGIATGNSLILQIGIYVFSGFYVFLLFSYTRLFRKKEAQFKQAGGNLFTDNERLRVRWVKTTFYIAIYLIGLWALLVVLFPEVELIETIFAITCIFVYFYFGVKYINYISDFYVLKLVVAPPQKTKTTEEERATTIYDSGSLSQKLEYWVADKGFTKGGITINGLAEQLDINRTYLSNYINSHENVNFNTWLNRLRVEEAKLMLASNPNISLSELASQLGYANQSSFSRQFSAIAGTPPSQWRKGDTPT